MNLDVNIDEKDDEKDDDRYEIYDGNDTCYQTMTWIAPVGI